jgi:NAD(P)-dependent dehydrogenase (short-subunit alcohol dehydrogenase family)
MQIQDQIVLITGGGSGMGAATAQHLVALGAKVVLLDKNEAAAQALSSQLNGLAFGVDVSDETSVKNALEQAQTKLGVPRIVINCAGIAPAKRLVGKNGPMPQQDFETVLRINLFGTFNIMRLAAASIGSLAPLNDDGQRGVIINTASIAAFEGQIGQTAYAASKAAIVGLTLPAARDLASIGIRVMTIAPGIMATPMMTGMPEEVQQNLAASVTFPKRLGYPQEFAFLVQQIIENDYLNGDTIRLDGALRMKEK